MATSPFLTGTHTDMYKFLLAAVLVLLAHLLQAQGSLLPLGDDNYPLLDRLEISSGLLPDYNSSLRGFTRGSAVQYALALDSLPGTTGSQRQDLANIFTNNNEWLGVCQDVQTLGGHKEGRYERVEGSDSLYRFVPHSQLRQSQRNQHYYRCAKPWLGLLYPTPANLAEVNSEGFHLRANPMLHLTGALPTGQDGGRATFFNLRGVELRGGFDDRIFFYSNITDNQAIFAPYAQDYIQRRRAVPSAGYYKTYQSQVFDTSAYNWLNAQAHIGFHLTRGVGMQFGHGRHFIGNGYRSLLLSDFSHNYLFLKVNWQAWRLHYQNLFAELQATSAAANPGDKYLPRKYMAAHYLSFRITDNMSFGFYEATVFRRRQPVENFELQYLNPVILYRTVEHLLDSEDNVLIGLDYKWNFLRHFRLYAQLMMDEFLEKELLAGNGWWANKWGVQAGLLYVNALGVDHLDLRAEMNVVRPYTYSHRDSLGSSYSHYNLPLAHPLGANFREYILMARYQPRPRLCAEGRLIHVQTGEDPPGKNYGSNILLDYRSLVSEYGNFIGQGLGTDIFLAGLDLRYELWHNIYAELSYLYRRRSSELSARNATDSFLGLGIRMNVGQLRMDF
jgi:hypothetical protein